MTARTTLRRFHRVRLTVFGILAVSYMLVFFHRVAPAVVASDLMQAFATSGAALGLLAAMYFYIYTAMQIPAGVLADTLGVRLAAGVGTALAGLGSILFGLAPDFGIAAVGRFFVGLGVSVVFVGLMRANTVWWSESRYGFVSGLTLVIGIVGAMLAAGPLAVSLAFASWRMVFVGIGIFSLVVSALTFLFVRNRPQDAGFPSLREMEGRTAHAARSKHWWQDLGEVLRNRAIWPGFWVNFGIAGGGLSFNGLWAIPMLRDVHGLARTEAALYTTVSLAASGIGAFAFGAFSDHIRRRKPVVMVSTLSACAMWAALLFLPWTPGWSGFLLFGLLGVAGSGFVVTYGVAKEIVAPNIAGMGIAVVNTGGFLGAALAQPLFGWLLDRTWDGTIVDGVRRYSAGDYANGLALCFGLALLSIVASLRLRETYCRNLTG